ncbi:ABATE domain-containing protein [Actinoplanes sp. Pm04-4]|uniref:ABATE domain-containing protein n=1 Tax=Paractinoplanes pyxinae TaxID=2997416 RepID=A0ABT4AZR1_9ACTN|nr:ABATE domain-containing protein [Actinoplanes pyxinae]MCY1139715.1 ABATE domain-containing protein [Actinoplanes pyxinae]
MHAFENLDVFGGVVSLDFANTVDGRATEQPVEYLHTYADLAAWSAYMGMIDDATAERLGRLDGGASLDQALSLREAIFQVFRAIGRGEPAPVAELDEVRLRYAEAVAAARLSPGDDGTFGWRFEGDDPDRAWWPIAVDAVRLLTGGPLDRIKVCAAPAGCVGLFLDTSKNRSRRWCTMDGCGVDAKVKRQATRRRTAR